MMITMYRESICSTTIITYETHQNLHITHEGKFHLRGSVLLMLKKAFYATWDERYSNSMLLFQCCAAQHL